MKFGIMLPHSGALAGVEAIRRVALEADDLGFDSVWCHDHITYDTDWFLHRGSGLIEQCEGIEPHFYESISTLTWVAGMTQNVKLGTAILVLPLRDPRVLARQAMTLQALSGGRLMLGVGIGDYQSDFRVMQIPYDEKNRITDEYIDVLNAAFQGGHVDFQGPNISFENASYFPKTTPKVPVLYGGGVVYPRKTRVPKLYEPAMRRIADRCDGWIPEGPPHVMAEGIKRIRELAAESGRGDVDFQVTGYIPLYIDDNAKAQAMTRKTLVTEIHTFEEGLAGSLVGSVGRISKVIEAYEEAGVHGLGMRCWAENLPRFVEMMRTFAREVMPRFS